MESGDTGVGFVLRLYSATEDYWALRPALTEKIKLAFDARGLTFPFPQVDVHLPNMAACETNQKE